mmetsp:Transcript_17643/g.41394  ORF Transcript_17643/g.41394 Transcript_17643/m.41394 type:complete len:354 (+) Transcript_17643:746-1807(+)
MARLGRLHEAVRVGRRVPQPHGTIGGAGGEEHGDGEVLDRYNGRLVPPQNPLRRDTPRRPPPVGRRHSRWVAEEAVEVVEGHHAVAVPVKRLAYRTKLGRGELLHGLDAVGAHDHSPLGEGLEVLAEGGDRQLAGAVGVEAGEELAAVVGLIGMPYHHSAAELGRNGLGVVEVRPEPPATLGLVRPPEQPRGDAEVDGAVVERDLDHGEGEGEAALARVVEARVAGLHPQLARVVGADGDRARAPRRPHPAAELERAKQQRARAAERGGLEEEAVVRFVRDGGAARATGHPGAVGLHVGQLGLEVDGRAGGRAPRAVRAEHGTALRDPVLAHVIQQLPVHVPDADRSVLTTAE